MEHLARDAHHDVLVQAFLFLFGGELLAGQHQQQAAKDVEHPGKGVEQGSTGQNEDGTGKDGEQDAEQQHFLLVGVWHLEARHDDQKHEQVVHAQGFFGDVAGKVLHATLVPEGDPDKHAEQQGNGHEQDRPNGRFLQRWRVGHAHVEEVVIQEQSADQDDRDYPCPGGDHAGVLSEAASLTAGLHGYQRNN